MIKLSIYFLLVYVLITLLVYTFFSYTFTFINFKNVLPLSRGRNFDNQECPLFRDFTIYAILHYVILLIYYYNYVIYKYIFKGLSHIYNSNKIKLYFIF